jgi:aspartate racemase
VKILGMIGGVGPESTVDYYKLIIEKYRERKPDDSYPPILINSINLTEMIGLLEKGELPRMTQRLAEEVDRLVRGGADFALLSSNTPHLVFDDLKRQCSIPLLSIVEETCKTAKAEGLHKLGLFGSKFTMSANFYQNVFVREGMTLVVPTREEQLSIHEKYMGELVKGVFRAETRDYMLSIANRLKKEEGIEALILGGTELPLLLRDVSAGMPMLDTTQIHVKAAVEQILS